MTLDEFLAAAPATLESFAAATRAKHAAGEPGMNPDQPRPEYWWYRDVAAYLRYLDVDEQQRSDG